MPNKYKLVISSKATHQIQQHLYYLSRINAKAAKKLKQTFSQEIRSIAKMPEINTSYKSKPPSFLGDVAVKRACDV